MGSSPALLAPLGLLLLLAAAPMGTPLLTGADAKCAKGTLASHSFISQHRFDLLPKIMYLRFYNASQHLQGFTMPKSVERAYEEQEEIVSKEERVRTGKDAELSAQDFQKLYDQVTRGGLDNPIPVNASSLRSAEAGSLKATDAGASVMDAGHAAAVAYTLGLDKVPACAMTTDGFMAPRHYNWRFFHKKGMPHELMDMSAFHYTKYADDAYILHLWPRAAKNIGFGVDTEDKLIDIVHSFGGKVYYVKHVHLNNQAHKMYTAMAYGDQPWVNQKARATYAEGYPLVLVFAHFGSPKDAAKARDEVRSFTGLGEDGAHVTAGRRDEVLLAKQVLFHWSVHYMNHTRDPEACLTLSHQLAAHVEPLRRDVVPGVHLFADDFAVDTGSVLDVYGLRSGTDFNMMFNPEYAAHYLAAVKKSKSDEEHPLGNHSGDVAASYHATPRENIIYDPALHFSCYGVKLVSLAQVHKVKVNRHAAKVEQGKIKPGGKPVRDIVDNELIDEFFKSIGDKEGR